MCIRTKKYNHTDIQKYKIHQTQKSQKHNVFGTISYFTNKMAVLREGESYSFFLPKLEFVCREVIQPASRSVGPPRTTRFLLLFG